MTGTSHNATGTDGSGGRWNDPGAGRPQQANFAPLSPVSFLIRAAAAFPDRTACVTGSGCISYADFLGRVQRLASALRLAGTGRGEVVSVMSSNTAALLESHYGVPMAGAVLNAINPQLDAGSVRDILERVAPRLILADARSSRTIARAVAGMRARPIMVGIDTNDPCHRTDYEGFLAGGDPGDAPDLPDDELAALSISFTSGTTGQHKGVVHNHRCAYLKAIGNGMAWNMTDAPVYLWTLPMFHCNGWAFPWTICAWAGTHVLPNDRSPESILDTIERHAITHLCAAPNLLHDLARSVRAGGRAPVRPVDVMTAGSAAAPGIIELAEQAGFRVTQSYGMTETLGSVVVCTPPTDWGGRSASARAMFKARQGVAYPTLDGLAVIDRASGKPVPRDATTLGEVMMRGNTVMSGYLDPDDSGARVNGWLATGDLAVVHPDGYVAIRDRKSDVIAASPHPTSSLEIEAALYLHPRIVEAAVVAGPDRPDGPALVAFVASDKDGEPDPREVIDHCRTLLPPQMVPERVIFGRLPRTATGKVRKYLLRRQLAQTADAIRAGHRPCLEPVSGAP